MCGEGREGDGGDESGVGALARRLSRHQCLEDGPVPVVRVDVHVDDGAGRPPAKLPVQVEPVDGLQRGLHGRPSINDVHKFWVFFEALSSLLTLRGGVTDGILLPSYL